MDLPVNFKFDQRIRARLLAKGHITEADVTKHLDGLADAQPQVDVIDLAQPALTSPEERERLAAARASAVVSRPPPAERSAPVSIAPAPEPVDEGWEEDDDEDDVDDEDEDEDEKATDAKATDQKATDAKATDAKATDAKATDEKAADEVKVEAKPPEPKPAVAAVAPAEDVDVDVDDDDDDDEPAEEKSGEEE